MGVTLPTWSFKKGEDQVRPDRSGANIVRRFKEIQKECTKWYALYLKYKPGRYYWNPYTLPFLRVKLTAAFRKGVPCINLAPKKRTGSTLPTWPTRGKTELK